MTFDLCRRGGMPMTCGGMVVDVAYCVTSFSAAESGHTHTDCITSRKLKVVIE